MKNLMGFTEESLKKAHTLLSCEMNLDKTY